jgi:hypothetical protein
VRSTHPRRFWLIARHRTGGLEVLRITLASGEEALPVFGFEEGAGMFLAVVAPSQDWRARVTTAGELVSVLFGPCAGVGRVVLDPLPGQDAALAGLAGMGRGPSWKPYLKNEETSPLATSVAIVAGKAT